MYVNYCLRRRPVADKKRDEIGKRHELYTAH